MPALERLNSSCLWPWLAFSFPTARSSRPRAKAFSIALCPSRANISWSWEGRPSAVSQGVIGVAIIQSLLAGIGFKLAGVPSAGLLAFAVMILTIVQIGAAIVLFPVIIWI